MHGILVQLPLPGPRRRGARAGRHPDPAKDVDGFHISNVGLLATGQRAMVPCTPLGCLMMLRAHHGSARRVIDAVVVGRSNIVGKPMAQLLLADSCTVTIAHSRTKNLPEVCRRADILVAAVGRPQMLDETHVKPGATVIDVGINRIDAPERGLKEDGSVKTRLVGDVDFDAVARVAGAITPVPGGVGPMTIACLLANTLTAACRANGLPEPEGTDRMMLDITQGRSKRRDPARPKGRQLDDDALAEVRALLGERPRRRDLLIEHLHLIQDAHGHVSAAHIRALAHEMRLAQVEVYEVASFYDHFDVVREGDPVPPAMTIRVCDGVACQLAGAEALLEATRAGVDPGEVRVVRAPCMGGCDVAPAARVGDREVGHATAGGIAAMLAAGETDVVIPDYETLDAYRARGGYDVLANVRSGELTPDAIIETLSGAGLRGLGGAGFPTGKKWGFVRGYPAPRLMTINGDEGEPGTFKDRHYLKRQPHAMLEGALIGAAVVGAQRIYLYMRDEYPAVLEILRREIAAVEDAGLAPKGLIELRRGAGAYICGEESAMLESIEGRRGLPRHRPPYIAEIGLFGRPTLNNNVETLHWVPSILANGAEWFAAQGKPDHPGFRSWSVSGRVARPGVVRAPAGVTANELIEMCGGMAEGHSFKAFLPGGASGGILPAAKGDVPLDFGGELAELGSFVGSHAVVVFSEDDDMRDVALNLLDFFTHESCGQCTPCRAGTEKMARLLRRDTLDETAIRDLEQVMRDASICGLGQAAPNPVNHLLTHFRDDLG